MFEWSYIAWRKAKGVKAINAFPNSPIFNWSAADIPSQAGKLAIVTGGTSGLGFEVAIALAQANADVVLAGRDESQGRWAVDKIRALAPASLVRFEQLDLANLAAVAGFAHRVERMARPLDLLVNNAGVMALPQRQFTADGFEMQLGTNYLGHFALTERLLPLLRRGRDPRVVQVSSLSHRLAAIEFEDLHFERRYSPFRAYGQSKLALLLFTFELQRRSDRGNWGIMSLAAHPGYARTPLFEKGPGPHSLIYRMHRGLSGWLGHSAESGALPLLYAATSAKVRPGDYYGPQGALELAGPLGAAGISKKAKDRETARKLWEISEQLTGLTWPSA
jgi:NAD(P)-dependent dehydrogenase (short-subunit alcohol dehydrogenase family)